MKIQNTFLDEKVRYGFIGKEGEVVAGKEVTGFGATAKKGQVLTMFVADELPLVIYESDGRACALASYKKEELLSNKLIKDIKAFAIAYGVPLPSLKVYIGPTLTFSHVLVTREELLHAIEMGYRAAAKRTSGVDFLDLPVMAILELRSLGIPFQNITPSGYDTFEGEEIFYSELRGDEEKNEIYVELLEE